jgi:hypothetical protein
MSLLPRLAITVIAVVLAPPLAAATPVIIGQPEEDVTMIPASGGYEGSARIHFETTADALVFVRLVPGPGNPIHDGTAPNGTVASDHGAGLSGWWIEFGVGVGPITLQDLGAFADGSASDAVAVLAGDAVDLQVLVHAPAGAMPATEGDGITIELVERVQTSPISHEDQAVAITLNLALPPSVHPAPAPAPPAPAVDEPANVLGSYERAVAYGAVGLAMASVLAIAVAGVARRNRNGGKDPPHPDPGPGPGFAQRIREPHPSYKPVKTAGHGIAAKLHEPEDSPTAFLSRRMKRRKDMRKDL